MTARPRDRATAAERGVRACSLSWCPYPAAVWVRWKHLVWEVCDYHHSVIEDAKDEAVRLAEASA